ncbi:MAG: Npt1/Npt2 family nucleotide transporter, partial [Bacteroidota bacterium]
MEKTGEFGWLRGMLFPIHRHEFRKFIPLTTIFCLLSMMYAMLRGLKEIFLLQHSTVEAMYFLKLFAVTPSMVLLTFLYSRISKLTNRDGRFNAVVGYFLAFFAIAHFFFIPHLEVLQLNKMADRLTVSMPSLHNLWEVLRIWPLSLLYIHAEGCVTMVWGVALWTFINEITHLEQSKRFYSLLGLGAEIGLISAGILLKYSKMGLNTLLSL